MLPVQEREHTQVRPNEHQTGYLLDVSDRPLVYLKGRDGLDLLQRISTNDVSRLALGESVQTILTNEKGRIVDVLSVVKLEQDSLLLAGNSTGGQQLRHWLEKYIIMEDASVENAGAQYKHFLIWGAADFRQQKQLSNGAIYFIDNWGGTRLLHILIPPNQGNGLLTELREEGYQVVSEELFTKFRVEHAIPAYPNELSDLYNPMEAGLFDLINFTKGCYIGQEVIARLDTYKKVQKRLVRFELGAHPNVLPCSVHDEKEEVGTITSVATNVSETEILALGYMKTILIDKPTSLFFLKDSIRIDVRIKA
ncbi:MAG TPA: hypothetical protein VII11_04795 [Bacteroidota bacterium]